MGAILTGLHSLPTHVCNMARFCTRFIHVENNVSLFTHRTTLIICSTVASGCGALISILVGTVSAFGFKSFKSTVNNFTNGFGEPAYKSKISKIKARGKGIY